MGEMHLQQTAGSGQAHLGMGMYLGEHSDWQTGERNNITDIAETNGENLQKGADLTDETYVKVGSYKFLVDDSDPDAKFVNLYAHVFSTQSPTVVAKIDGSQLRVLRFTPVDATHHGWTAKLFESACEVTTSVTSSSSESSAAVVYSVDLDPNDDDPLQEGDVLLILGEAQAKYTGTTEVFFNSQIRLSDSDSDCELGPDSSSSSSDPPVGKANDFSMRGPATSGVRERKAAVKTTTYVVDEGHPAKRFVKLVAWAANLPSLDEVEINPTTVGAGKLSVLRFRHAVEGDRPIAVTRYDQPEFNAGGGNLYAPMEQLCALDADDTDVVYSHELTDLDGDGGVSPEILVAISELEATNQYPNSGHHLKTLKSQLVLADAPSTGGTDYNLSLENAVQVDREHTHHVSSSKVGIRAAPSSISPPNAWYVNRLSTSDQDFTATCYDDDNDGSSCSCCKCPVMQGPGDSVNCSSSQENSAQCDVIQRNDGRLAVLRLSPLAALACIADISPSGPPMGDGTIDVDDLFVVINGWGNCPSIFDPCPGDVNDNGVVDVDDMFMVINAWGDCPSGASRPAAPGEGGSLPEWLQECIDNCGDDGECVFECILEHEGD